MATENAAAGKGDTGAGAADTTKQGTETVLGGAKPAGDAGAAGKDAKDAKDGKDGAADTGGDAYVAPATKADLEKLLADATKAEAAKFAAPEKYELKLPDTPGPFTEEDLAFFGEEAKALGLTQERAQALVQARVDQVLEAANGYLTDLKADKELGGKNFDGTVKLAARGRDLLFPPGQAGAQLIAGWFNRTGIGNHPEVVRAFVRLAKMTKEDQPPQDSGGDGGARRDTKDVMYPPRK